MRASGEQPARIGIRVSQSRTLTEPRALPSTGSARASRLFAPCQKAQHRNRTSKAPLCLTVLVYAFEPASFTHMAARWGGFWVARTLCIQPIYDVPIVPTAPLLQDCLAIHSTVS